MVDHELTKKSTKNRVPNFSPGEKEALIIIAMKYSKILEDKRTNRAGLEEKAQAWQKIESEFNNTAPILVYRSQEQLKRLYENKKKDLRKKFAEHKKETYLTGGGPAPTYLVFDNVENILSQILSEKTVKGFHSEFDSDNVNEELPENVNYEPSHKKQKLVEPTNNEQENVNLDINNEDFQIYEFSPVESTQKENANIYGKPFSKYLGERCPPTVLQKPINIKVVPDVDTSAPCTVINTPSGTRQEKLPSSRRRPVAGLHALTSSEVGEKYNILLDKRLVLVERQLEQTIEAKNFTQEEHKQNMKNLKLQEENLTLEKEENC